MVEDRVILSVASGTTGSGMKIWMLDFSKPDGSTGRHVFPQDTLLWRSIEYGIDINDVDTLLDVILHEPFVPDPLDPATHADDAAAKLGHTVREAGAIDPIFGAVTDAAEVPVWLYNAPDVDTARAAHLARIEHAKANRTAYSKHSAKVVADPLDIIRDSHRDVLMLIDRVPEVRAVYDSMHSHIAETRKSMRIAARTPKTHKQTPWERRDIGHREGMA